MPARYVEHRDADIGVGAQGEGDLSSAAAGRYRGQAVTRYNNTVNFDGRIHPDRVGEIAGGNYT